MAYRILLTPDEFSTPPHKDITIGSVALSDKCPATIYNALVNRLTDNTPRNLVLLFYDIYLAITQKKAPVRPAWFLPNDPIYNKMFTSDKTNYITILYSHIASLVATAIVRIAALPDSQERSDTLSDLLTFYLPMSYIPIYDLSAITHTLTADPETWYKHTRPTTLVSEPILNRVYNHINPNIPVSSPFPERDILELCRPFFYAQHASFPYVPQFKIDTDAILAVVDTPYNQGDTSVYFTLIDLVRISNLRHHQCIKQQLARFPIFSITIDNAQLVSKYLTSIYASVLSDPSPIFADQSLLQAVHDFITPILNASNLFVATPNQTHQLSTIAAFKSLVRDTAVPYTTQSPFNIFFNISQAQLNGFINHVAVNDPPVFAPQPFSHPVSLVANCDPSSDAILRTLQNTDAYTTFVMSCASTLFHAPFTITSDIPDPIIPQIWSDILLARQHIDTPTTNEYVALEYENLFTTICHNYRKWAALPHKDDAPISSHILTFIHPIINLRRVVSRSPYLSRRLLSHVRRYICQSRNPYDTRASPASTQEALITTLEPPVLAFLSPPPNDKHSITTIVDTETYAKELSFIVSILPATTLCDCCAARIPLSEHLQHHLHTFQSPTPSTSSHAQPFEDLIRVVKEYPSLVENPFTQTLANLGNHVIGSVVRIDPSADTVANAKLFIITVTAITQSAFPEIVPVCTPPPESSTQPWWLYNRYHTTIPLCSSPSECCTPLSDLMRLTLLITSYLTHLLATIGHDSPVLQLPAECKEHVIYFIDNVFQKGFHLDNPKLSLTLITLLRAVQHLQNRIAFSTSLLRHD